MGSSDDKVEKVSRGSLDLILSPSPSNYERETVENKMFVDITQQCFVFVLLPRVNNFMPIIWIFIKGEGEGDKVFHKQVCS